MESAILIYRHVSLPRMKSTSTNAPHTFLGILTMIGRLKRPLKPLGRQIAAHGETAERLDSRNDTTSRLRIAAFRRSLQALSNFRHYFVDWDVWAVRLDRL